MKKFGLIAFILIAFSACLLLSGCGKCKHTLEIIEAKEPTCTEKGNLEHYKCTECGALFGEREGLYELEEFHFILTEISHSFKDEYEYDDTQHWSVCQWCGLPDENSYASHITVFRANCQSSVKCLYCPATAEEKNPQNHVNRKPEIKSNNDGTHTSTYTCCNVIVTVECHGGEATCGALSKCADCNAEYGELDKDNHRILNDNDCSTADSCDCGEVVIEAKAHEFKTTWSANDSYHMYRCENEGCQVKDSLGEHYGEDDGDCTTHVVCEVCDWRLIEGKASHTPEEDDGDSTTPVKCQDCDQIVIFPKSYHGADENCN